MCRSLYNFADKERLGTVTHEQFVALLNTVNPYEKQRFASHPYQRLD